ncbi:MAG TPA: helix-turn-helix domain-containing protein [Solirubrobacterales bacterium]|nr:helix-turn-helix domain-containing protein [Solirubrobacterales bacterium]
MASAMAPLISVPDAADALGLSAARVRLLAANGALPAQKIGGRWLVERSGVEKRRSRGSAGGRPFAPRNAWAVMGLASGDEAAGIDPVVRSRLRRALALEGLGSLRLRLERRAEVHRYLAHPGEISHLFGDKRLVPSGAGAARAVGLDLMAGSEADGYVSDSDLDGFVRDHVLLPAAAVDANVVLRVVPDDVWAAFLKGRPHAPEAAVALDLVEDVDSRSKAAGEELLRRLDSVR